MNKPDRFVRAVERAAHGPHYRSVFHDDAIRLLRNQFAAIRRVVKGLKWCCTDNEVEKSYNQALDDLLVKMDAWRKGQP
jgi:hypothetical protein